ncbi:helix-turn-helix domain-containing protein [Prauserella halophila]|uniref:Helix-turn-helix domain-containing protein n=2 Tax=Prauserella halophila TaxID=185641 RepID=A0ABN1WJ83_9PSEU
MSKPHGGEAAWRDTCPKRDTVRPMPAKGNDDLPGPRQVQFLTVAEVASLMRVSKMTVYRLVHSGELPAVRVGKSFRVPEQAVHDYLDNAYFDAG